MVIGIKKIVLMFYCFFSLFCDSNNVCLGKFV